MSGLLLMATSQTMFAQMPSAKVLANSKVVLTSSLTNKTNAKKKIIVETLNYERPIGYLFNGISNKFKTPEDGSETTLGSPYVEATWFNNSNFKSPVWLYKDPYSDSWLPSKSTDLNVTYNPGTYPMPKIAASTDENAVNYSRTGKLQIGGNCGEYGASPCDYTKGITTARNFFGWASWGKYVWATIFPSYYSTELEGMGNYMEAPATPYTMSKVWAMGILDCYAPSFKLNVEVYKASKASRYSDGYPENGGNVDTTLLRQELSLGDLVATGTCTENDTTNYIDNNGNTWSCLSFQLKGSDGNDTTLVVDQSMMIKICGFAESGINDYWMYCQDWEQADTKECPAYFFLAQTKTDDSNVYHNTYPSSLLSVGTDGVTYYTAYSAFMIFTDASFPWIHSDEYTYDAPTKGGSKTFAINSNYAAKDLSVSMPADAKWLTYSIADVDGGSAITFNVDSIPADASTRECDVVVSGLGAKATYTITQKNTPTGINANVASSDVKVMANASSLELTYPSSVSSVNVYNAAGQQVAAYTLNGSRSSISTQNWAKGIYMLKFNNGRSVKIIR